MWAIAIIGCSVFMVWKRPKAPERIRTMPVTVTARLRPEDIKSFTSAYEEKRRMTLSIESLENKAQKGKIPRRRYKVQRKTLETRLNSLSRTISETREKMRAAGSQYAELTRQLETAEMEIGEVETNIKSIEVRHSRGELPLEAYRKLLADYERRKEKANTTIDGILLRLREESR
jgi:chromosome segregation ATPase